MDVLFEMTEAEKHMRWNYLHGDRTLMDRPMRIADYNDLETARRIQDEALRRYHAIGGAETNTNTILYHPALDSEETIDVVRHRRYSYPLLHNHDFVELIYVYQGRCRHYIESETIEMQNGDFCLLTPNSMHALSVTEDDAIVLNILVSLNFISQSFLHLLQGDEVILRFFEGILYRRDSSPYILYPTGEDRWMHGILHDMYKESLNKDYLYNASVANSVRQIFIHLLRNYQLQAVFSNPLNHQANPVTIALINYIAANYDHITLKSTAERFGYNSAYLSQLLKQYTGKSFSEIIAETKIANAKRLLVDTSLSVTEIGQRTGYYDASHFTRHFHKMCGVSPLEYRRRLQVKKEGR